MPSTATNANCNTVPPNGGELLISILSLDGLPTREGNDTVHASHVTVQACGQTRQRGIPFTNAEESNHPLKIQAKPLQYLYDTSFLLQVVYEGNPEWNLKTTFAMKDLGINQVKILRLKLIPSSSDIAGKGVQPSIQIQAELKGDFRREIQFLIRMAAIWFRFMDTVERTVYRLIPTNRATQQLMLLPAFPAFVAALLLTPFVAATLLITIPLAFPLVALFLSTGIGFAVAFFLLYASTSRGRQHVYPKYLAPLTERILTTKAGQSLLYPIGPRPTPVDALELVIPQNKYSRLLVSIVIDFLGGSSYLLPFFGEASDLVWAPLQTILIMAMYNESSPKLKYLSFLEEILPFTDVIPSATIGWVAQYYGRRSVEIPEDLELKEE